MNDLLGALEAHEAERDGAPVTIEDLDYYLNVVDQAWARFHAAVADAANRRDRIVGQALASLKGGE